MSFIDDIRALFKGDVTRNTNQILSLTTDQLEVVGDVDAKIAAAIAALGTIVSGTYLPVLTIPGGTSVSTVGNFGLLSTYTRIGNIVTVSGFVSATVVSTGNSTVRATLPFVPDGTLAGSGAVAVSSAAIGTSTLGFNAGTAVMVITGVAAGTLSVQYVLMYRCVP